MFRRQFCILYLSIYLFNSCTEKPVSPVVVTIPVSSVSYSSASSGGAVTNEGGTSITDRGVCWSTSADPTITGSKTIEEGGFGAFTSTITQLTGSTLYYLRAYATNEVGTGYGREITFTTLQSKPASITTLPMNLITQTGAVSGGNIASDNGAEVITRGICWSTTALPTIELSPKTIDGTGTGEFTSILFQLIPNTMYYVRAYAINSAGTAYGNEITFTTSQIEPATLTTSAIISVSTTNAVCGGNITNEGGSVTDRGVCWSTSPLPTSELNTKTKNGNGPGSYVSHISGLQPGLTYYVRAYAINETGTAYGNQIILNTKIADVEGNTYNTILIGNQVWMAENLKTTRYSDNSSIPLVTDNSIWATLTTPAFCWYNDNPSTYKSEYGALYNWNVTDVTRNGNKNVCPTGWHIPSYDEWSILINYLGGASIAGGKLKEAGTNHWQSTTFGVTNESGFTALPGGRREWYSPFFGIGMICYCWSGTKVPGSGAMHILLSDSSNTLIWQTNSEVHGFSIRCLRDF